MKYLSKIVPLTLALTLAFTPVQAQQNIDGNRLNRDINIMESVLSEMFRVKSGGSGERARIFTYAAYQNDRVRGTYLPGYGVIFQISSPSGGFLIVGSDGEEKEGNVVFQYGESGEQEEVTPESVKNRIVEFLKDYGSTIGQLQADEHVMVIYGGGPGSGRGTFDFFVSSGARSQSSSSPALPVISVSAQMSDLSAYRSGDLGEQQFRNRVSISETERNSTDRKDLRVMANIFDTAFEDNEEGFEVRGSVDYLHLDNFGALFFFEARYGSGGNLIRAITAPNIQIRTDSNRNSAQARARAIEETRQAMEERQQELKQKREEVRQKTLSAYETFKQDLREYLVDYGRTLSSVGSGQHILVSITLNSSVDEIPDRIDVQVTKSVLEQMDRGAIDRQQAISRVSIREY